MKCTWKELLLVIGCLGLLYTTAHLGKEAARSHYDTRGSILDAIS